MALASIASMLAAVAKVAQITGYINPVLRVARSAPRVHTHLHCIQIDETSFPVSHSNCYYVGCENGAGGSDSRNPMAAMGR